MNYFYFSSENSVFFYFTGIMVYNIISVKIIITLLIVFNFTNWFCNILGIGIDCTIKEGKSKKKKVQDKKDEIDDLQKDLDRANWFLSAVRSDRAKIWDKLILNEELHGLESNIDFLHVSRLDIYKKLITLKH